MTEITVSVRHLVEFLLRHGDIDSYRTRSPEDVMQAGSKIHRKIQKQAGPGYEAEVRLAIVVPFGDYSVRVEGRADGVITDKDGNVTIDEIKGTYRNLEILKEPVITHLAQAMCYAYMVLTAEKLKEITVQMTYCNLETEAIRRFKQILTAEEITEWFTNLMKEYGKWAEFQVRWDAQMKESVGRMSFPFAYRKGQEELIHKCLETYEAEKFLFLEAPTGCGKTITTLYPAIQVLGKGKVRRIFYLTAKTIARTVASDTLNLLRENALRIKSIVLTAKEKICVLPSGPDCNPMACPRAKGHYDRVNEAIFDLITSKDEWSREVIEEYAARYSVCPFEFALDVSLFADVIIGDYNYVYDPHVYLRRFFAEANMENYLFLTDEAHNLVDRAREMYSASLRREDMMALAVFIEEACEGRKRSPIPAKHATRIVNALNDCAASFLLVKRKCDEGFYVYEEDELFSPQLKSLTRFTSVMQKYLEEDETRRGGELRKAVLNFYFDVLHFQEMWDLKEDDYKLFARTDEEGRLEVKLMCLNPRRVMMLCNERAKGGAFFSATLFPMEYYRELLGGRKEDREKNAASVFPLSNRLILAASDVTSRYEERTDENYTRIAGYIVRMVKARKGNYMVFFPSFDFAEKVYDILNRKYAPVIFDIVLQSENMSEEEREAFLSKFGGKKKAAEQSELYLPGFAGPEGSKGGIEKGFPVDRFKRSLVGFCVLGGIFAEGIDLTGEDLIGVAVVGGGIPYVTKEREFIREYFDDKSSRGFEYAYQIPGMNKVLQSAGRLIRTEEDKGIILYLEKRFLKSEYEGMFPAHMKKDAVVDENSVGMQMGRFWKHV